MNQRIKELVDQAKFRVTPGLAPDEWLDMYHRIFAELVIEETLAQVDERTYGRGENQWYYDQDKDWVRLHFGYGKLSNL